MYTSAVAVARHCARDAKRGAEKKGVRVCPQLLVFRIKLAETAVASDYARENF